MRKVIGIGKMARGIGILVVLGIVIAMSSAASENAVRQGKFGFFKGATTMLSSLAQDLINRSGTSSQVLSLNLTNLFILLVLKAIVFGAGSFGYGPGSYGRNVDTQLKNNSVDYFDWNNFLSESELLMMLSYLNGDASQDYGCLQRIVCQDPHRAEEYSFTGKLFLKGYELLGGSPDRERYEKALLHVDEAILDGLNGHDCLSRYRCQIGQP